MDVAKALNDERVTNEEILEGVGGKRTIFLTIRKMKINFICLWFVDSFC